MLIVFSVVFRVSGLGFRLRFRTSGFGGPSFTRARRFRYQEFLETELPPRNHFKNFRFSA